jgi:hypothetical protein
MYKKYRITLEHKQRGKVLKTEEKVVEGVRRPEVGEGYQKLVHPPISITVTKVSKIEEDPTMYWDRLSSL